MTEQRPKPIHVAVFDDVRSAAEAVLALRDAGFQVEEISVLCSDKHRQELFKDFVHEQPSGTHSDEALKYAGVLGLGGVAVLTGLLTATGIGIFAVGALAGIAAAGTFVALMLTRGVERELADYYDQAVRAGKLLVAVETDDVKRQKLADEVFQRHGDQPIAMPAESSPGN